MKHLLILHQDKLFICLKVVKRKGSNLKKSPIIPSMILRYFINAEEQSRFWKWFCVAFFSFRNVTPLNWKTSKIYLRMAYSIIN